jgi:glutathione synthase/RimK-type ligase-like ATP-grasp enzyme
VLSGVDLKHDGDRWVLLEANSSPAYLDIERRTGAPISAALLDAIAARLAR